MKGVCYTTKNRAVDDAKNVGAKALAAGTAAAASSDVFVVPWTCKPCYHRNLDSKLQKC